jgi:hypothetical protein
MTRMASLSGRRICQRQAPLGWSAAILVAALAATASGCSYSASFNRSPYVDLQAAKRMASVRNIDEVKFLKDFPKESHVVLGTLHAPVTEWTAHYDIDDLMLAMRKKAVEIGADAIVGFRTRENPSVVGVTNYNPSGSNYVTPVPFKGLHAWAEAIMYVPADKKALIEAGQ